ncbi:ribonucleotide-diphosphate reductase subunit beta [Natribacillus halophilus]|uniref:Ribonucleoside-diphosphate reductase subunit beta n=1 Tax=Natribacillus halophilus TaxID=549003 RepID=A0A1G8KZR0_9BACI|nr:ribonucleotide-diphosphate reductase subunit beta [Natribacillus halophilus]SDI48370.1 ribonucleoside-diphosphate reductase beta chain [Natribacillus halophilus]
MTKLMQKVAIMEPANPVKSTGIIHGKSSGILNWNDIAYPSFYRTYRELLSNFWIPQEVNMGPDTKSIMELSDEELRAYKLTIGLLATLDTPQARLIHGVSEYVSDDSVHAIAAIIAQQEVVHNESYSYALSTLFSFEEQKEIFDDARRHPTIIARNERIMQAYDDFIQNPTEEKLVRVIVYSLILEGIFFYSGFAFFYNLARQQKMNATAQIISFINRDELVHGKFMSELLRAILGENPNLNDEALTEFIETEFQEAVESEIAWSNEVLDGIVGIDLDEMHTYIKYRANKMLKMLGIDPIYPDALENGMPWIKAFVDNFDETKTDFFEARNRSYEKVDADNEFDEL